MTRLRSTRKLPVTVEAAGFKQAVSKPVLLEVSRDIRVDLKLQPGAITEKVEVTTEGALADTVDSTLEGVLSNKAINELPLQGRDFQNFCLYIRACSELPAADFTP